MVHTWVRTHVHRIHLRHIVTYIYHRNQPFQIPWGIWRWWNTLLGSSGPCYLLDVEHVTYLRPPTAQHICTQTHTHTLASLASQTAAVVALADLTRLEEKMNTPEVRAYFVPWQPCPTKEMQDACDYRSSVQCKIIGDRSGCGVQGQIYGKIVCLLSRAMSRFFCDAVNKGEGNSQRPHPSAYSIESSGIFFT